MAADAGVLWNNSDVQALISETQNVELRFDNVGSNPGFGPFVDLVLPTYGKDDAGGLSFVAGSAKLLDNPLKETVTKFDSNGRALHPLAKDTAGNPLVLIGNPGYQLVVLELPFGSYVADQPQVQIDMQLAIDSNATIGQSLPVLAAGGFRYGNDPLNNPTKDPSIRGITTTLNVIPNVLKTQLEYIGPENETTTGKNFLRGYRVLVDIAQGAEVSNLQIMNQLDSNQAFVGISKETWSEGDFTVVKSPEIGIATEENHLIIGLPDSKGVPGLDGSYIVNFFIPETDASNSPVIDTVLAQNSVSRFFSQVKADWKIPSSIDNSKSEFLSVSSDAVPHVLQNKVIATQVSARTVKDVNAKSLGPGDLLEYAIDFQVSDFASLNNVSILVQIPNGLAIVEPSPVPFTLTGVEGFKSSKPTISQFGLKALPTLESGATPYVFDLTQELKALGLDGTLHGASTARGQGTGVTGRLTFQATVLDQFESPIASGDLSVDERDQFLLNAFATGSTVEPESLATTKSIAADDSRSLSTILPGDFQTSVYAINGLTVTSSLQASAGDLVTYRVRRVIRSSDVEDLVLSSFLPLPVHKLQSLNWGESKAKPSSGLLQLGPDDSFHRLYGALPSINLDAKNNRLALSYKDFDSDENESTVVDLLLTVAIEDSPFADGMWLTKVANATIGSSNHGSFSQNALTSIQYTRPVLSIVKGVAGSDNPNAVISPAASLDSNITGVDAGDQVRFRIVVSNTGLGSRGAYDTVIKDTLPIGYSIPKSGLELTVTDGFNRPIKYLAEGKGESESLFGLGLRLPEPILNARTDTESNQVIVSYVLQLNETARANTTLTSEASIVRYAAMPNGQNYVTEKVADSATTRTSNAFALHTLISTDQAQTSGTRVVIGETATFRARVTLPEGKISAANLQVNLPRGVAIQQILDISASDQLIFAGTSLKEIIANAVIVDTSSDLRDGGRQLRIRLGDIENLDRDNANKEYLDILYSATVTNDFDNNAGTALRNTAVFTHSTGNTSASTSLAVVEPSLDVIKSWRSTRVDALDKVTVSMDVRASTNSGATAYDVLVSETLPAGVTYVPGSLRLVSGNVKPMSIDDRDGSLQLAWNAIAIGQTSRFEYDVIVHGDVHAGATLTNHATVQWSSLSGDPGQIAKSNALSFERNGDAKSPGTFANDYIKTIASTIQIAPVKLTLNLVETSHPATTGADVTIGEQAIFEIVAVIPEGVHQLRLIGITSNLDPLVLLESLELISIGKNLSGDKIRTGLQAKHNGNSEVFMDLGWVKNQADNVASDGDKLVFRMVTRIPNDPANQTGDRLRTDIRMDFQYGEASAIQALNLVEPDLRLTQKISLTGVDAKDIVEATIQVEHSANSSSSAMELELDGWIEGTGLTLIPGSIEVVNGSLLPAIDDQGRSLRIGTHELVRGAILSIRYKLQVSESVMPGDLFQLPTTLKWTSIKDDGARSYTTKSNAFVQVNSNSLVGSVTVDTNQDGIQQAGDFGVGDVEVQLTGIDHLGNKIERSVLTDGNGKFVLDGLRPGVYALKETQPEFLFDGLDFVGAAKGLVSNDAVTEIQLAKGSNGVFGGYRFTESPLTWISGTVFVDEDQNRMLGQAEQGIEGILVTLVGTNELGNLIERKTWTNDRGYYVFGYLDPGTYSVIEGDTPDYFDASEQLGNRGGVVSNDRFDRVRVTAAKPGSHYNFGEYKPGTIRGQIYIDYDRDGVLDNKDGLVSNVDIQITGIDDLGNKIERYTVTDKLGSYSFESLRPGVYDIQSQSIEGLESSVSNVGIFNGGSSSNAASGVGVPDGFRSIRLSAGAVGNSFNIGHVDPSYESTLAGSAFQRTIVINGTNAADSIVVAMTGQGGQVQVNDRKYDFDASETLSIRIMGSFGVDSLDFTGSENKESIDLRRGSARITGTWFESLIYGMENMQFTGGGNEDLARFYDTPENDLFQALPFTGWMSGEGYKNSVSDVHRIYAYATKGTDEATLTGSAGQKDDFNASPEVSKLDGDSYYLYTSGFDSTFGNATDALDRAHLFGSIGDDRLTTDEKATVLESNSFRVTANGFSYVLASASEGGKDSAVMTGSSGDDRLSSRPLEASFQMPNAMVKAIGFENMVVQASAGYDVATFYDSHYQDTFTANPAEAILRNATGVVQAIGFEQVTALMEAGGDDVAVLRGSTSVETFKASPTSWSLTGIGYILSGSGFTKVTSYGDANDLAYLYDSAFNDVLELTAGSAVLSGQRFQNEAFGFGKVNAEAQGGFDRVLFFDSIVRSTVRYNEQKTTVFGQGFSHNATGFDTVDAYYADLNGLDNVELSGRVAYAMLVSDLARARFKLSLRTSAAAPMIDLKTRVDRL